MFQQITDIDSDSEHTKAYIKYASDFTSGKWCEIPLDLFEQFMATALELYESDLLSYPKLFVRQKRVSFDSQSWNTNLLIDAIMILAYPLEPIEMSVSRLFKAVGWLGFKTVSPYSAAVAYKKFEHLKTTQYHGK